MKIGHKIDSNGYFIEDVIIEDQYDEDGNNVTEYPEDVVFTSVPQPCFKPRWDGSQWIDEEQEKVDYLKSDDYVLMIRKDEKIRQLNNDYEAASSDLLKYYPATEKLSFSNQEEEAKAYLEDNTSPVPVLSAILKGRNGGDGSETLEELAQRVLAKADAFMSWQEKTGYRQRLEKQILNATSMEELDEIAWSFT